MAHRRAKLIEIWDARIPLDIYGVCFDLAVFSHFAVIRCTCLTIVCHSKTAGLRAKYIHLWDSRGASSKNLRGICEFIVFKVI